MCKKLQSMFADTPLIKNLENSDYRKVILNGKIRWQNDLQKLTIIELLRK